MPLLFCGGDWSGYGKAGYLRCACRDFVYPVSEYGSFLGFRCVRGL
jgi:formylglycine-generating enzyme required for sulfatase activity